MLHYLREDHYVEKDMVIQYIAQVLRYDQCVQP